MSADRTPPPGPHRSRRRAVGIALVVFGLALLAFFALRASTDEAEPVVETPPSAESATDTSGPARTVLSVPPELISPLAPGAAPTLVDYPDVVVGARRGTYRAAVVDGVRYWVSAIDREGRVVVATIPPERRISGTEASPAALNLPGVLRENDVLVLAPGATLVPAGATAGEERGFFSGTLRLAVMLGIALMIISAGYWTFRRLRNAGSGGGSPMGGGGGLSRHGRSRASARVTEVPSIRFADVAGCEEAVDSLGETIAFLQDAERFSRAGARMPRGLILHGPPGTGKTLLAKACAGEAGVPFYESSGSEFVEMYVGVGAARVRDLFHRARQHPEGAIIYIDEIDAIGQSRGGGGGGNQGGPRSGRSDQERDQTLNQLLTEMDGFRGAEKVVIIASTNRLELLDAALLRPGRLDRHLEIGLPGEHGRREILAVHAANKTLADEADLDVLAAATAGLSGADLENVLNEAAIIAACDDRDEIRADDLTEGHLRSLAGREKADQGIIESERVRVAWHEAGHALAAELCPAHPGAQQVTIARRGQAMGLAFYPSPDRHLFAAQDIYEQLIVALAGRAAERVEFGDYSSGAANDLEQASQRARAAILRLGFSARVGPVVGGSDAWGGLSASAQAEADQEVTAFVNAAQQDAEMLLRAHHDALARLAAALLSGDRLLRDEILEALALPEPCERAVARDALMVLGHGDGELPELSAPAPAEIPAAVVAPVPRASAEPPIGAGSAWSRHASPYPGRPAPPVSAPPLDDTRASGRLRQRLPAAAVRTGLFLADCIETLARRRAARRRPLR